MTEHGGIELVDEVAWRAARRMALATVPLWLVAILAIARFHGAWTIVLMTPLCAAGVLAVMTSLEQRAATSHPAEQVEPAISPAG